MKVKAIARDEAEFSRERTSDLRKVHRNLDPVLRPMEKATEYTRALAAAKLNKVFARPFVGALSGHVDTVTCLARSPTSLTTVLSASADGAVRLWDLARRTCRATLPGHMSAVRGVCVGPDGRTAVTAGDDQVVRLWRLPEPEVSLATEPGDEGEDDDDDDEGGAASRDGNGARVPALAPVATFEGSGAFRGVDHRWAGSLFATAGIALDVWDAARSTPLHTFRWGADSVTAVRFNPADHDILASAGADRSIALYDLRVATPLRKVIMQTRANAIAWNPREPFNFVAASEDSNLYTYDMRNLSLAKGVHRDFVSAAMDVDFSPTGREFVAGSYDRTVRIFPYNGGRSREVYHTKRMQRVFATRFSGDGAYVLSGSDDGNVRLWKARASEQLGVLKPREKRKQAYSKALLQRFSHMPEIKRIERHRHLPKPVYKAARLRTEMQEAARRKSDRFEAHAPPGSVPHPPARKKRIVAEVE